MYQAITLALIGSFVLALTLALVFLALAVVGWLGPHRNRRLKMFALFAALTPVLYAVEFALVVRVFLPSMARDQQRDRQQQHDEESLVHVGELAPEFRIQLLDGAEFAIDDLRGKTVLVNFFATWCGPCNMELPHLQEIWDANHTNPNFAMLIIGREETDDSVKEFRLKHGYSLPMAADPDRSVYALYAKQYIPRTYLIFRDGKILLAQTGFDEAGLAELTRTLDEQLAGKPSL